MVSSKRNKALLVTYFLLILIILFSLCLRLYRINYFDLWFDEIGTNIFSYQFIQNLSTITHEPVKDLLLNNFKNDPNSSFYYLCIYGYSSVFGNGKILRYFSLFFSVLSIFMVYVLAKEFFGKKVGLYAILFLALSPFHIWYAQEARVYSMLCFFSVCTVYLYMRCLIDNKNFYWILFAVFGLATLFLSYHFVTFLIISLLGVFFSPTRKQEESVMDSSFPSRPLWNYSILLKWILSISTIGAIAYLATSPFLSGQLSYVKEAFWLKAPSIEALFQTIKVFTFGYIDLNLKYLLGLGFLLFFFVMGVCDAFTKQKNNAVLFFSFLMFPILFVFCFSHIVFPIYLNRQISFVLPFYFIFIASGLASITRKRIQYIFLGLILLLLSFATLDSYSGSVPYDDLHRLDGVFTRKKCSSLIESFRENYRTGDLVVVTDILSLDIMLYEIIQNNFVKNYDPKNNFRLFFKPKFFLETERRFVKVSDNLADITPSEAKEIYSLDFMFNTHTTLKKINVAFLPYARIWVTSSTFRNQYPLVWNAKEILDALEMYYHETKSQEKDGVSIKLYERMINP